MYNTGEKRGESQFLTQEQMLITYYKALFIWTKQFLRLLTAQNELLIVLPENFHTISTSLEITLQNQSE